MAVAFEGFSIREYTAKMRSVDVAKCWPFPEDLMKRRREEEEEEAAKEALLPPMSVVKFKWWSHELSRLRSESGEKSAADQKSAAAAEMMCPVCRVFVDATVNEVNAHIDDCLVADQAAKADRRIMRNSSGNNNNKVAKAKSKPRKKRSITEIFAVAPQIEAIENASDASAREEEEDDDDDDDEADENDNVLVEDFKVLSVSSSRSSGPTIKKSKKVMKAKKRKKENKRVKNMDENDSLGVPHKIRENNKKLKKKKKKNVKKKKSVDGSIATKRSAQKFKLHSHVNLAKKLTKRLAVDILGSDSVCGKNSSTKCLSTQDKQKLVEPPKLIARNEEPIFPIRSILKSHTSCEKKLAIHNIQRESEANSCGIQLSERHVRFSGKDDILGPKKDFCSFEQNVSILPSDALASSPENVQSTNHRTVDTEVNRSEYDTSMDIDYGTEVQAIEREQSAEIPHVEKPSSPRLPMTIHKKMELLQEKPTAPQEGEFCKSNLCRFDQGHKSPARRPPFTCLSTLFPTFGGSCGSTHIGDSASSTLNFSGKLINDAEDTVQRVYDITPRENASPYSQPLSCFTANETANNRLQFQSQPSEELVNTHTLRCRPLCHLPPTDFIGGLCSFPEWKQRAVALRKRSMDEGFFGLPLNSQGELIQSSSRGKGLLDDLRESDITRHSSSFFPAQNLFRPRSTGDHLCVSNKHFEEREFLNDRGNPFLAQNCPKENTSLQGPARFGVTYWESTGREDVSRPDFERRRSHSFQPLDADLNLTNISFDGNRKYEQLQNQKICEMIHLKEKSGKTSLNTSQPTMRLMGKDVPIGKSSKELQGFEDEKVWTDKEIIVEHCISGTRLDGSSARRNFQGWVPQMSRQCKEAVMHSLEIESEKSSQNHLFIKGPGPSFSHPYLDWPANASLESDSFVSNRNLSSNFFPFAHLPASSRMFSRAPNFQDFFISGAEPLHLGSQLPVLSAPQNSCEHVHWRPAELCHRGNLPHFTKPGFEFPFLNPDSRVNVQSSWFQNSKSLPPWLLHAKQQGETQMISSQQGPIAASKLHHHISSRTNILKTPSIYDSAEACYSCSPRTSHLQINSSLDSATVVIPPLGPVISGVKPASFVNTGYRNRMKVKERLKSKALGVKDLYPCKKSNKRLVSKSLDLEKPTRIFNLEKEERFSALAGCTVQNLNSKIQCDMMADDLLSNRISAKDLECQQTETQDIEIGIAGNELSRADIMARSGPIKLSAGAKHILKPNQNMDLDNFMPIHSTIPFAAATNVGRVPETQTKAAKIYRF